MATKELPKREELPIELTWRLEDIFSSDDIWKDEYKKLQAEFPKITNFQGKLGESSQNLYEVLTLQDELSMRIEKLYTYAHMRNDQDTTNSKYQAMNAEVMTLYTQISSAMSYIVPEILSLSEEVLDKFLNEKEELKLYRKVLDDILRVKPHVLSEKEESLLAQASEALNNASQTFGMLNNADLVFPKVHNEQGEEMTLTHSRFIRLMESQNRKVREEAFKEFYKTYGQFKNTFASTLSGAIKTHNFEAAVHHYDSARLAALNQNKIPETVYDQLIEAVNEKLPLLHRYTNLRKNVLGVKELHMYDVYTPLVQEFDMDISYDEAKDYVLKGLQPMGEAYQEILLKAFQDRWIDVEENKGKRSGAYSSGAYGTNPYILLNWQNNLDNTFTLAHELGHSVHSYYTRSSQPYRYGDYSIFVAEVASTCNEALLSDYLLKNLKDEKQKLFVLNHFLEGFRGTVFRQTMFAEFEHQIHTLDQQGVALTAEKLSEVYYALNKKYYGEDMVSDEEISLEWARIPHFYYNYYVYQYATGYSAAMSLSNQILSEGESAVNRYREFLKAGSSDYPIEVLKKAGVDMTTKQPILEALKVFEEKLTEMEQLLLKK